MKKELGTKAIQIFKEFERLENRLPGKSEFDQEFYGRILKRGESNYYYQVKRKYLQEKESEIE